MSLRKRTALFVVFITLAAVSTASASAARGGFDLTVEPQNSFVAPGQNVTVSYAVTNNTGSSPYCYFNVVEINFNAALGTIASGTTAGGQLSTPGLQKNGRLTFNLICDNTLVASKFVLVKIR
ncbi:hypothetical protein H0X09_01025 [Candidatus Saccharibacteria bacterium]|nr:hypothetical protein [Candidatus Saccharibacteria bacterium]